MTRIENQTVLITGAASGIGRSLAFGLAREGMSLYLADIDMDGLEKVRDELEKSGTKVFIGRCWEEDAEKIVLLDADEFEDGRNGCSKEDYIRDAAKVGVWKKHDRIIVPRVVIASVTRLGEIPLA